jgi:bifunctional UDP-N-acetylglucosamine pyrophosphorylase/glucosamine-1-phosphate N-acetyltransferase
VQAVVLAAGKGTRMKSGRAKVLHSILGLPLIEHVLRALDAVAPEAVAVVVGHQAEAVEAACAGRRVRCVRQDPPQGTGHALQVARPVFADSARTLLVVNGDLPLLRGESVAGLLEAHRRSGAAATLVSALLDDGGHYGRVVRDGENVRAVVEARDASAEQRAIREINAGVYVFEVEPLLGALEQLAPTNAQGEYYLTDVIGLLAARGHRVGAFVVADASEMLGVNTLAELADLSRRLRDRRLAALMAAGVVVEDPLSTWVGLDVVVEADAVLRPGTILEGRCTVRGHALLGPNVRLENAEVGAGAQILDHCLLRDCVIGAGAVVGPFAHIRPESVVGPKAKVGNFVELKKTRLGEGSKAPHLAYVGDATVGPGVNIGAGTITCNYDGHAKYPTRIDAGVFVGSNSTLVAPLHIGAGAYVGAGSVITEDVPEDALALGRGRQVVKAGWAKRRREREKK